MSIVVIGSMAYDTIETAQAKATGVLGGSVTYFSLAARFFGPVSVVAVVGSDFKPEDYEVFVQRNIDLRGLSRIEGRTMRWHGRYHEDMNRRDTLKLELNVFADFAPELLPDQRRSDYVFLANIAPDLQEHVLSQVMNPKIVAADTMNHWIENERAALLRLLKRLDILTLNDEELRLLSGEHNLVRAGRAALRLGPGTVLVKRGEYGVIQFSRNSMFAVPAYPLEEVVDPTGAGDAFAGGFMGFLARNARVEERILRSAVVYGSVLASFAVEQFSIGGLLRLTWDEVDRRYRSFIELTDAQHPRWTSP